MNKNREGSQEVGALTVSLAIPPSTARRRRYDIIIIDYIISRGLSMVLLVMVVLYIVPVARIKDRAGQRPTTAIYS